MQSLVGLVLLSKLDESFILETFTSSTSPTHVGCNQSSRSYIKLDMVQRSDLTVSSSRTMRSKRTTFVFREQKIFDPYIYLFGRLAPRTILSKHVGNNASVQYEYFVCFFISSKVEVDHLSSVLCEARMGSFLVPLLPLLSNFIRS